ncbi:MAG: prepilin-type N-terminal cleavage/methylation domain-containing protein [Candidatus Omnitrophota bacterium]
MSRAIRSSRQRGFTLIEVMTASMIALYVFAGAWGIFIMTWKWWHETLPVIEAERVARLALMSIVEGTADPTAGVTTIGTSTHARRNGIMWATSYDIPSLQEGREIDFDLLQDGGTSHVRAFYLDTAQNAVYYRDNANTLYKINSTSGLTGLKFEKLSEDFGGTGTATVHDDIIKVTATVEKDVIGTRGVPYHIKVEYSDTVHLDNL